MPEGNANMEIAEHLREHGRHAGHAEPSRRRVETIEILEAILLALVALAIALGQRFQIRRVRYAMNVVAGTFLVYCIVLIATYPHA
ncbi:MAG TPA: hypothetical protein VIL79_05110 [Thermoleophilia bacterium]